MDVHKEENVQCYGNSFILVRKLYSEQMFNEPGFFETELAVFEMNNKLCEFLE